MAIADAIPGMKRELRFFPVDNPAPQKLTQAQT